MSTITPAKPHLQTRIHTAVSMANPIKQPSNLSRNFRVNNNPSKICDIVHNHKNYNFLNCDWFKKLLFPTNSLAKLLSDSLLSDSLLSDTL